MILDQNSEFLYVSAGLHPENPTTIYKISLQTFQQVIPPASYGKLTISMAISNDNNKLYIRNGDYIPVDPDSMDEFYSEIGIFNTSDLSQMDSIIFHDMVPSFIRMGYDNRLFVTNSIPMTEMNNETSLYVIDTNNDEIIKNVSMGETGLGYMALDPINQKLYCTTFFRDEYDPDFDETIHRLTPEITLFDLMDPAYTPSNITIDNEGLWIIALSYSASGERLFASTPDSNLIHYQDL